jgi:acetoin utilization protein AcuC
MSFIWDEELRQYDFGPGHPLSPIRSVLTYKLIESLKILDQSNCTLVEGVDLASDEVILRVHDPSYVESVKLASIHPGYRDLGRGLGTDDVPVFAGMDEAARRVCGATLAAVKAVHSGDALHAVNISGGLHHAHYGSASGFCVYNDPAVGIAWLLDQGVERVAYVDVDVHHGDGVQQIFYADPRVMTVSLHESGRSLFPGTGKATEIGGPNARGSAVNISLRAGTCDDGWLRAFDAVVPEVLAAFKPQIIVSQQGCDSHRDDPLANLRLTLEGQRASYLRIHELAHELCDGRWIALGGGGYDWIDVVPLAWAHLTAIAAGSPIPTDTRIPEDWRTLVKAALGREAPTVMGDGVVLHPRPWSAGSDPLDPLDRAVLKTMDAVYPALGLQADPYPLW